MKLRTIRDLPPVTKFLQYDCLRQIVEVVEDPDGLNYDTTYVYDPLDNLTSVAQGGQNGQTRTFSYSSLSRLNNAYNPESGTVSYSYYDSGDLQTRTDARGVTTTMTYDGLHRIRTKTYNDGTPTVTYAYKCEYDRLRSRRTDRHDEIVE
jgi:YD repeat-containing protein